MPAPATQPVLSVNWQEFLSRHDLIWQTLPKNYAEAPFLGNGQLGSILYYDHESKALKLEIFRADVHDHRDSTHGWTAYSRPRFTVGWFSIGTRGDVVQGLMRLDLWNAELTGRVSTSCGGLVIRHSIYATEDLMVFECSANGDETVEWSWHPGEAKTTRPEVPYTESDIAAFAARYGEHYQETLRVYQPNPPVRLSVHEGIHLSVQDLLVGGQYAVAWKNLGDAADTSVMTITIENSIPRSEASEQACERLESVTMASLSDLREAHGQWWHRYYPLSFISIPDARLESFYWIQMYKLACATRADKPIMDTSGPWFQPTPWPYITTDLNLQLCYWPVCASNRMELGLSLIENLKEHTQTLIENVRPVEWQIDSAYMNITCAQDLIGPRDDDMRYYDCIGNLAWTMHNVWMMYRSSMDDEMLKGVLLPLLERCVNMYIHIMDEDRAGTLHLAPTYSPEYPDNPVRDCNYDLALLKWGCKTLIEGYTRIGVEHIKAPTWKNIIDNLVAYPVDENGIRVGGDVSFAKGHRHFSHLLMIYPIYDVNVEQDGASSLVEKSVDRWISSGALAGYSFTGASSLSSAIGDGNAALGYLKGLDPYLEPNTLYLEAGPCMETPLAAAQSIHDMLIQSWGGILRIFPAVADEWGDAKFHHLRGEGGVLVSACRKGGQTMWVHIESLAGEPCRIRAGIQDPECYVDGVQQNVEPGEVLDIVVPKGGYVLIKRSGFNEPMVIEPLSVESGDCNSFGLRGE